MMMLKRSINQSSPFLKQEKMVRSYASAAATAAPNFESFVIDQCKSGKITKLDDALGYFDKLISTNPFPSPTVFSLLIGSVVKIKCCSEAFLLYKKMNLIGISHTIHTFSHLINCCCQLGHLNYGFCLFGEILKRGYHPDIFTFNILIKGLCLQNQIGYAFQVSEKMTDDGIQPNIVTCTTLITRLCRNGEVGLALQFLRMLEKWNCKPDVVTYGVIIDGLCKGGSVDQALKLLSEMIDDSSIVPNIVVYNCLIHGLCNSVRLSEAIRLFDDMSSREISADATTYNSLIYGLFRVCIEGPKDLLYRLCFISAISSALFTNDTSCVVLTEFVLKIARHNNIPTCPFLLALVYSSNIGSSATPIGNPQNFVIAAFQSKISFRKSLFGILPAMLVGVVVNRIILRCMFWRLLSVEKDEEDVAVVEVEVDDQDMNSHRFSPATMSHSTSLNSHESNSALDGGSIHTSISKHHLGCYGASCTY